MNPNLPAPRALWLNRGALFNPGKVKTHISLETSKGRTVSKVLVCVDSECTDVDETRRQVTPLERKIQKGLSYLTVRYVVVDHSLEGWLLCDRGAVREALGGEKARLRRYRNPERCCRPAELLRRMFRDNGREFIKTKHLPILAQRVNIDQIAQTSNTFRDFQQALQDP